MNLEPKASALARAAPTEWKAFLAELVVLFEQRKTEMLRAPVTELEKAQGRAQALAALTELLSKAK